MGVKRPLVEENLPELSFKQPKQLDDINQTSTIMTHDLPIIDCLGEAKSDSCVVQANKRLGSGEALCASTADNELERMEDKVENLSETKQHIQLDNNIITLYADGPLYWTTTTSDTEDDTVNEDSIPFQDMHAFPRYADISLPPRPPQQLEDPYISSLNSSPTKEVPEGPDYQAELPDLDPNDRAQYFSAPDYKTGTCIIPMPNPNVPSFHESIIGRGGPSQCSCVEVGSVRCVRRHIRDARKNLRESLGDETFGELGFYSMGEEVACKWACDEERLFHETIVSNPPSCGPDFWEMLGFYFPNRTRDEIVSYYFNVFMLRWRAVQNRSYLLCADSDDDETAHGEECTNICLRGGRGSDDEIYSNISNNTNDTTSTTTTTTTTTTNRHNEELYGVGAENEDWIGSRDLYAGWVDGEESGGNNCARVNVDQGCGLEIGGGRKGGLF